MRTAILCSAWFVFLAAHGAWAQDAGPVVKPGFAAVQPEADGRWRVLADKLLRMPGTSRERAALPAGTILVQQATLTVREAGRPHRLVLWHGQRPESASTADGGFNDAVAVLGVHPEGQGEASDVAEVKSDRHTAFGNKLALGPSDDAFVVLNTHHNAGQPYTLASLFHIRNGRLRRIAEVDLLGELFGCQRAFDELLEWRTEPDGRDLPTVVARVTLIHAPRGSTGACSGRVPAERREVFEDRWRWDAARGTYVHQGGSLARLARWNDERR